MADKGRKSMGMLVPLDQYKEREEQGIQQQHIKSSLGQDKENDEQNHGVGHIHQTDVEADFYIQGHKTSKGTTHTKKRVRTAYTSTYWRKAQKRK